MTALGRAIAAKPPDAGQPVDFGAAAQPSTSEAFAQAHQRLLQDRTLQFDFTAYEPPTPPAWLEPLLRFLSQIAPAFVYIFWIGVALVACLILYLVITAIIKRLPETSDKSAPPPGATATYRPEAARAKALLEEADRLAAAGRFSEAARVLLHRSIEDFEQKFALNVRPGYTSREIARLEPLSTDGRDVFSSIARAVETSLFGGRDLTSDDYARCRQSYARFALQGRTR